MYEKVMHLILADKKMGEWRFAALIQPISS